MTCFKFSDIYRFSRFSRKVVTLIRPNSAVIRSLLASSSGRRIFIYICGQYGIQKKIYIYAGDTRSTNLHQNKSPTNHAAWFVARAAQFLYWNRAVLNCVQVTCTRKNLYQTDRHTCKFLVRDDLHKFLVQDSSARVADNTRIPKCTLNRHIP